MTVEQGKRSFPSRRDFVALGVGAFVVGTVPWAARNRTKLVRRTIPVMGTLGEMAIVHKDERYAYGAMDAAFQELLRVEALLTRLNLSEGRVAIAVNGELSPRSERALRLLQDGDTVEVIHAVAGG